MSILPTWPIAAGALVVGLLAGTAVTRYVYQHKIDAIHAGAAEVDRQRAEIRANDERDARTKEQRWAVALAAAEQEKVNAQEQARAAGAAALNSERMRQRAERRPAPSGGAAEAATTCQGATGAELSRPDAEFLIREATRANVQRAALAACYKAYDEVSK